MGLERCRTRLVIACFHPARWGGSLMSWRQSPEDIASVGARGRSGRSWPPATVVAFRLRKRGAGTR